MRTLFIAASVAVVALASAASITARGARGIQSESAQDAARPWEVGRCYRVFPADRDQLYIFKVIEPPAGSWVRVQPDPAGIRVPGARAQAPLWLNLNSPFAVQEWSCSG